MTSWRQRLLSVFAVRGVRDGASESRNNETGGGPCSAEERTPLPDEMANLIARIASDNGVETEPLRTVLEKLGQLGLPHHAIPTTLDSAASGLSAGSRELLCEGDEKSIWLRCIHRSLFVS